MGAQKNVLGHDIGECSCKPLTGWYRDGRPVDASPQVAGRRIRVPGGVGMAARVHVDARAAGRLLRRRLDEGRRRRRRRRRQTGDVGGGGGARVV